MVELVAAGELAPKTVNNARTWLSVAFNVVPDRVIVPTSDRENSPPLTSLSR
jgi:hypothetical protein